jgi:hypothetical protein
MNALVAAVDLVEQALLTERGERIAERLIQRLRRARKPLTNIALLRGSDPFSVPSTLHVLAALIERGDVVLTDDNHYLLPERS